MGIGEGGEGGEPAEPAEVVEPEQPEEPEPVAPPATGGPKKKLTNQFNFCERAALTYTNPSRVKLSSLKKTFSTECIFTFQSVETQTIPPPRSTFGGNVYQHVIYDAYSEDFELQQEKEKDKKVCFLHNFT
jgi:dynein intermediate chain 1, axonemal